MKMQIDWTPTIDRGWNWHVEKIFFLFFVLVMIQIENIYRVCF